MKVDITEDEANELDLSEVCIQGEDFDFKGHTYKYVDTEDHADEHRWNYTDWYIFKRDDGKYFSHAYDWGLTESQENGYIYSKCELFEVEPYEVTTTEYKEVK